MVEVVECLVEEIKHLHKDLQLQDILILMFQLKKNGLGKMAE